MAIVASLDLTNYLQVASPPTWIGHGRYMENRCALAHGRSSVDLLRTIAAVDELNPSVYRAGVPPRPPDVDRDNTFQSRDAGKSADSTAGDCGFSSDSSSEETNSTSSSSSSSSSSSRKHVWFADDVGLDLVSVRHYDPLPTPAVDGPLPARQRPAGSRRLRRPRLDPAFRQPWHDVARLRSRLDRDAVALESVSGGGGRRLPLAGTVLALDPVTTTAAALDRRVTVRCTFDSWASFVDVPAVHVTHAAAAGTHLFAFEVREPPDTGAAALEQTSARQGGGRGIEFAVRYQYREHCDADWTQRWDNNDGRNYQMLATW